MNERHSHVQHAANDPQQLEEHPTGVLHQQIEQIELIQGDDPELPRSRPAPAAAIDARRARELAFELQSLAELAERLEQAR